MDATNMSPGVDGVDDGSHSRDGKVGLENGGDVRGNDGDCIAGSHTFLDQSTGKLTNPDILLCPCACRDRGMEVQPDGRAF